ncbi:MAG: hypothetical protein QM750_05895 [Rubrivivax sp.]
MNKRLPLALIAAAALLGGCAGHHMHHGGGPGGPGGPMGPRGEAMYANPLVTVKGGVVSISPEPLVFLASEKDVRITWRLGSAGLSFPDNGIVVEGRVVGDVRRSSAAAAARQELDPKQDQIVDCKRGAEGREFSCLNRNTQPGRYKYTIRVLQDGKPLQPFDPEIMNLD